MCSRTVSFRFVIAVQLLLVASSSAFEIGTERSFTIINDVSMYDLKTADQSIGYRISGAAKVAAIWGNDESGFLLRFELQSPKLYLQKYKVDPVDYDEKPSTLKSLHKTIFYASWKQGIIDKAFLPHTKDTSLDNFLRSVLSLFQFQLADTELQEEDISGTCDVRYVSKSSTKFMKYKDSCSNNLEFIQRDNKPLSVSNRYTRVTVLSVSADSQLESIHSTDHHKFSVNAYPNVGFVVGSLYYLKFDGASVECETLKEKHLNETIKKLGDVVETNLLPVYDQSNDAEETTLLKLVKKNKKDLLKENVGKSASARTLLKFLPTARLTKTEDLTRIVNARSTKEIRGQLMDLLGAIQTEASHETFRKSLNLTNDEDFDDVERYLQSLAVGVRPEEAVLRDLLTMLQSNEEIENVKLKDTLVQAVSSMANRFAHSPFQDYESHVVVEVKNFLMKSINKCPENDCKVIFIRGLQNLQSPDTVEKLLSLAINFPYEISVAAMKALGKFSPRIFSGEFKTKLEDIFYQRFKKFDSSARTIALDILLQQKLETADVVELVAFLKSSDTAFEIKQYLNQRLRLIAEQCSQFSEMLRMALSQEPEVNNWNVYGALKGLSTVIRRRFSQQPSFNGSLLSVQEMKGGALKRGTVDLMLRSGDEETSLFSLGIFAGGLSSFISSSDAEEADPEEEATATAGMELAIQGVQMRPLTFFKGQGELMGHVWSGTASEPTAAYQATTLLQDHKQIVPLNNGAFLDFTTLGAISIDLNGKIEISLWYKTANSEVVQNIGTALSTSLFIRSSMISLGIESQLAEDPRINLTSNVDFSAKTAMCMQLNQPNTQLVQTIKKSIRVPAEKKSKAKTRQTNLKYNLPGYTHVLNRKNTEMCNLLLK